MNQSLANFERFDGSEDWTEYVECFQQFLIATKIDEEGTQAGDVPDYHRSEHL